MGVHVLISGTVKFYNSEQAFGIIRRTDGEKDVRFRLEALKKIGLTGISAGQKVKFETTANPDTGKITADVIELE